MYKATLWLPFCNNCAALHSINKLLKRSYKTQTNWWSTRGRSPSNSKSKKGKHVESGERYVMVREIAQQQQRLIMTINTLTHAGVLATQILEYIQFNLYKSNCDKLARKKLGKHFKR